MNETLIGEEITLVARAGEELLQLILGAATHFLLAADARPRDLSATEGELRSALADLEPRDSTSLTARLVLVEGGMDIHLAPPASPDAGVIVNCPV